MTTLYLVRHAESESNRMRTFTGQMDIGLTEIGREQAKRLAAYLSDVSFDAIYASDLSRVKDTVRPTAEEHGMGIIERPALREIYGGAFEGRTYEEIGVDHPKELSVWLNDIDHGACPEGESIADVAARVTEEVLRLAAAHDGGTILIATHATPVRVLLSSATGRTMQELRWVPNASTSVLTVSDGRLTAVSVAEAGYLGEITTTFAKGI